MGWEGEGVLRTSEQTNMLGGEGRYSMSAPSNAVRSYTVLLCASCDSCLLRVCFLGQTTCKVWFSMPPLPFQLPQSMQTFKLSLCQ
jgi:hypothetical protein